MEAVYLERNGYNDHAREVLEFAVDKGSDISASYKLLALLYEKSGEKNKKDGLKEKAALLNSASKNAILRALED
jgi:Tfp pilus assembly protein PilF